MYLKPSHTVNRKHFIHCNYFQCMASWILNGGSSTNKANVEIRLADKQCVTRQTWIHDRFLLKRLPQLEFFKSPKWAELQWLAACSCQQEPEWPLSPCISTFGACYTAGTNAADKKGAKKSKFPTDLWPRGSEGTALHAYRRGSNRVYGCIIAALPHPLSARHWTPEPSRLDQTHQASLIHSPPRCLCQVIAGGKRKTDQYISHGPDR